LNGVLIKAGVNASGLDLIYPKTNLIQKGERIELDACLGTTKATMAGVTSLNGE